MGEKIATDLRVQLFTQLLHQDMSFYDSQKTGELCDRLSYDVQEFKSSFKSCIAQGLRTFAQVRVAFWHCKRLHRIDGWLYCLLVYDFTQNDSSNCYCCTSGDPVWKFMWHRSPPVINSSP
jgi:ABC-type multidrug transport system fused ATPase/permease subunit